MQNRKFKKKKMKNQFTTKLKDHNKSIKKYDVIEKRLFDLESKLKFDLDKAQKDIFDLKKDSSRITNILNETREIQELDFNHCKKKDFKTQEKLEKKQEKFEEKQEKHQEKKYERNKERDCDSNIHPLSDLVIRSVSQHYQQACERSRVADENFRAVNNSRSFEDELEMRDILGRSWLQLENESAKLKIEMQNILFADLQKLTEKKKKEYEETLKKQEEKNKEYHDEIKKQEEKNKKYFEEIQKLDKEKQEYYKKLVNIGG